MAYRSLREFLDRLERAGELVRVKERVDPVLEMAALADRAAKQGGPALLFEHPASGSFPVAMNLFGTRRRTSWALSCDDFEDHARELRALLKTAPPQSFWDKLKMLPKLGKLAAMAPKHVSSGPSQEAVDRAPDLGKLPVLTTWPHDGGPFVTLPQVITRDPETGIRNVGMYRLQVLGPRRLAMHWQLHKTANAHFREYRRRGARMPVAIALGGDPALTYCASAPLPPNVDEYLFAGFLRGEAVRLVKGVATGLDVPADADLVIEGFVDMAMPVEGVFHNLCLLSIKKEHPGQAKKVIHGLWGSGQMAQTKTLVVFDDDVDVQDVPQAAWRAFANVDVKRDLVVADGPVDVLDHAAAHFAFGGKIGVDATRKWREEGGREWPEVCVHPPEVVARMDALYERLVPAAPRPRRPKIAPPPAASWTPPRGGTLQ